LSEKWRQFKPKYKEIWKIDIPVNESTGHEQRGIRPCLVIKDFEESGLILVIPITGNLSLLEFSPYTVKIEADDQNNLENDSVALLYQIKTIDKSLLKHKIGRLINEKYTQIEIILKEIFRLKNF